METEQNKNPQLVALTQLIKDLGVDQLAEEKQSEIKLKMTEALLKQIFVETMEKLGEDGREEYEKLSEGEIEPEQMEAFFSEKITNYDKMIEEVVEEFKREMLETSK